MSNVLANLNAAYAAGLQDGTQSKSKKFEEFTSENGIGFAGKPNADQLKKVDHSDNLQKEAFRILKPLKNNTPLVVKFLESWKAPAAKTETAKAALVEGDQANVRQTESTRNGGRAGSEW